MEVVSPNPAFMAVMFLIVISILVFVHEMGHYLVARLCGVRVETFSIGFGREIYGWHDKHGTRWRISALPLGGYVKFFGDAGIASNPDEALKDLTEEERRVAFHFKPLYQRAAVVAAGPLVNYLFAILIFSGFFFAFGHSVIPPKVGEVMENSAASEAGILAGDTIKAVDGVEVDEFGDIGRYVMVRPDDQIILQIERQGQNLEIPVVLSRVEEQDEFGNKGVKGQLGISSTQGERRSAGFFQSIGLGIKSTWDIQVLMIEKLKRIIVGKIPADELGGPLKIAKFSGEAASIGFLRLVEMIAFISLSLGFMNLLPIPMLDGGHLAFYGIEALRGKPVSERIQEYAVLTGFAFILVFFVFVTWNDLRSFGVWDKLSNLLS